MDTATACTSAAVLGNDDLVVAAQHVDARRHAEVLPVLLQRVLAGIDVADIDLIAVGVGPGPFTGLRVGIATAVMMGEALHVPVVGACSLDVIARQGQQESLGPLTVVTRARRAEVNWAAYDGSGLRTDGPLVLREDAVDATGVRLVGDAEPFVQDPTYPRGEEVAAFVLERLDAGEPLPSVIDIPVDEATSTGISAGHMLAQRAAAGLLLLPPRPIYLRRADAVPPVGIPT